jgi:bacillithiol system protein YtxJ
MKATADFNYLDLLTFRSASNYIAKELNVMYQSPQIIVLKDKKLIFKDLHYSIELEKNHKFL